MSLLNSLSVQVVDSKKKKKKKKQKDADTSE